MIGTTRYRAGRLYAALFVWGLCIAGIPTLAAADPIAGSFALEGAEPGVAGELTATPQGNPLDLRIDVMLHRPAEKNALRRYDDPRGEEMRILAVSDDFGQYFDRHVSHVIDGHGQVRIRFPAAGLYHLYVDAVPRTLPRQIVRFDLPVGDVDPAARRAPGTPTGEAEAGPYTVRIGSAEIPAGRPTTLRLHVEANGKPARDLHALWGEPALVTLISEDDLSIVPVTFKPSTGLVGADLLEDGAPVPPDLAFALTARKPGSYRLFVELAGGRASYSASLTLVAH